MQPKDNMVKIGQERFSICIVVAMWHAKGIVWLLLNLSCEDIWITAFLFEQWEFLRSSCILKLESRFCGLFKFECLPGTCFARLMGLSFTVLFRRGKTDFSLLQIGSCLSLQKEWWNYYWIKERDEPNNVQSSRLCTFCKQLMVPLSVGQAASVDMEVSVCEELQVLL